MSLERRMEKHISIIFIYISTYFTKTYAFPPLILDDKFCPTGNFDINPTLNMNLLLSTLFVSSKFKFCFSDALLLSVPALPYLTTDIFLQSDNLL